MRVPAFFAALPIRKSLPNYLHRRWKFEGIEAFLPPSLVLRSDPIAIRFVSLQSCVLLGFQLRLMFEIILVDC